jgi:outer membrane protein OmpA-like peptidoglycan-associated protein
VKNIFIIPLMAVAFLAACASAPERSEQLEQARAHVQTLSQDPMAAQAASRELEAARNELSQADAALEQGKSQEEVNHLAYLAARHAEIGQARIAEARARQQIAQGEAERNRTLLEARTREAEAAKREAVQARSSAESMAQQLAMLQAEQTQRGMVMTLSDVLFDTGAATLKPGADLAIDRIADFLQQNPQTRIIIEGHTDSQGSETYNEELSQRRGRAVSEALASRGISGERVQVRGRGEAYPVASNTTAAGRQQNRRVEIIFSDEAGRFAQGAADASLR